MPTYRSKSAGNWRETSIWQSVKSKSGSRIVVWRAKRTAKDNKTSRRKITTTVPTTTTTTTIRVIRVREGHQVTTATPITIQVTRTPDQPAMLGLARMSVIRHPSSVITILIQLPPPPLQPPPLRPPRQVILVTTAYSIRITINDRRPFTPCENRLYLLVTMNNSQLFLKIGDFSHERKKRAKI